MDNPMAGRGKRARSCGVGVDKEAKASGIMEEWESHDFGVEDEEEPVESKDTQIKLLQSKALTILELVNDMAVGGVGGWTSESVEAFVHNAMELSYMAATATITKGLQNEALNDARDGLRVILED